MVKKNNTEKIARREILCLVAGRSGGHIIPAMALASEYKKNHKILFFSTNSPLDRKICNPYMVSGTLDYYVRLAIGTIPPKRSIKLLIFLSQCFVGLLKSFFYLIRLRPTKIISMGGYVSIPVCVAGWLLRIPLEVIELNATPGKAVLLLSKIARKVHTCFPQARTFFPVSCDVISYPTRFSSTDILSKSEARALLEKRLGFSLSSSEPTLLILGGSQGSHFINKLVLQFLDEFAHKLSTVQIFHQAGGAERDQISTYYKAKNIKAHIFDYCHELNIYYSASDFVVCRAGAGTLFELLFFQKPAIVIPLETRTTAHQADNANAFSQAYPALITVLNQKTLENDATSFFKILNNHVS